MEKDKENMEIIECNNCGNETYMDIIGNHNVANEVYEYDQYSDKEYPIFNENTEWKLYLCPICNNVTLIKIYWNSQMQKGPERFEQKEILYPISSYKNFGVPDKVSSAFNAALKSRHVDHSICLLALRRTLEMVCKEKEINEGMLGNKLKKMVEEGIIPPVLNDASYILKELGNEAAHGDDVTHTKSDVEDMIEFTEYILNYVYVLPYKIGKVQERKKIKKG